MYRRPKHVLTPEEKNRKEQKKLLKRQEKLIRARQSKLDELKRALAYGNNNSRIVERKWKRILTSLATYRIQENLLFAWMNFERSIDYKDFIISIYLDEVKEAEQQYMNNFRRFLDGIDCLMKYYDESIEELKFDYNENVVRLQDIAKKECQFILSNFQERSEFMKQIIFFFKKERKLVEDMKVTDIVFMNEEANRLAENTNITSIKLGKLFTEIEDNLRSLLNNYCNSTKIRKTLFERYNDQEIAMKKVLKTQLEQIHSHVKIIKHLKRRYKVEKRKREKDLCILRYEKSFLVECANKLKHVMLLQKRREESNIENLTIVTNNLLDGLGTLLNKGEHILNHVTICRKFETEDEKIMPFPLIEPCYFEDEESPPRNSKNNFERAEMRLFWKRIGTATTIKYTLDEERRYLQLENTFLKEKLHAFCRCVDCPILPPIIRQTNKKTDLDTLNKRAQAEYKRQLVTKRYFEKERKKQMQNISKLKKIVFNI